MFTYIDIYTVRARVVPALIAGLPTLALLVVVLPWSDLGLPHAIAAALALVLLLAFADIARRRGRHVQAKLGTGTTPEQWFRDNSDLPQTAKDSYRDFIAHKLKRPAPSADEEREDPARARDFYLSAGNWLREHTRDNRTFRILFDENMTYGFRRNLLGLKPIALGLNTAVLASCVGVFCLRPPYFNALSRIGERMVFVVTLVLLHSAYMLLAVNNAGVREASRAYGRQLILSCETLMTRRLSVPKAAESKNGKG